MTADPARSAELEGVPARFSPQDRARAWSLARRVNWESVVVAAPTDAIAASGSDPRRLVREIPVLRAALLSAVAERGDGEPSDG